MRTSAQTDRILDAALSGTAPSREECRHLLSVHETSPDARMLMAVADQVSRKKFGNEAILLGQIGVETAPCPGECDFCAFNRSRGQTATEALTVDAIQQKARDFTAGGDLYALFLMTMHDWDLARLEQAVVASRAAIPNHTRLVVNVGDFGLERAKRLKDLGVSGAYHVLRLREGTDSQLRPDARLRTIDAVREAGLDFYYCVEPIGPEHTPDELVEQMFVGVERGSFQHAAMRRVAIPGSKLHAKGQITNLRLAQVTAVVALATLNVRETTNIAVHEPNLLGRVAGANAIYAETGANPRDTLKDTAEGRGLDVSAARRMLHEAGFAWLRRGDGTKVPLTI